MISFTLLPLYPQRKARRFIFDVNLGGSQNQYARCGEENISLPEIEHRFVSSLARSQSNLKVSDDGVQHSELMGFWTLTSVRNFNTSIY
jgi:hypothetical protein